MRLINTYGPTEATVAVTWFDVPDTWDDHRDCPIGPPLPHVWACVLDRYGQPPPVGFPGELHVGGSCLARGYLRRPGLTAERFIPNPFGPGRLYRTGDRARWLADGMLAYCGRLDRQVKIRGVRIEPEEVETALERHPAVREAAVTTPLEPSGHRRLVAHVATDANVTAAELRAFLKHRLPDAAVPSGFAIVASLPRTPSGKIDRTALPPPSADEARNDGHENPRTPIERALALIWCEALEVERVGRHDDFFTLGGHSLMAARILARIRDAFGVAIAMPDLMAAPTVVGLAAAVERGRGHALPHPTPVSRDRALPLSFAQQAMWLIDQIEPMTALYNVPMALRLRGELARDALQAAIDAMVARHEVLRTTLVAEKGQPFARISAPASLPMTLIDVRAKPPDEREAAALEAATTAARVPFDLARDWPLRASLVRMSDQEHLLVLVFHHVAFDARSAEIVVDELGAVYASHMGGDAPTLPPMPIQHADYAAWQREVHDSAQTETRIAWWRTHLADAPQVLDLPLDHARPARPSRRGNVAFHPLDATLTSRITTLSRAHGATTFLTLLTAFQVLLHRWTDAEDIMVGCPVTNREIPESENLIGLLVETVVFRADFSNDKTFTDLLRKMRDTALGAYANTVPFETLVEALASDRDVRMHPLAQVAFSYLPDEAERSLRLPGLTSTPVEIDTGVAKLDLHLAVTTTENRLRCRLEYDTDLFTDATARRLLAQYATLLASVVIAPEQPVSRLQLMSYEEHHRVVIDFNRTASTYPRESSLGDLFVAQARKAPQAIALTFDDHEMTYGELDARSARLARMLRARGVEQEARVGLLTERSLEMIVAMLAIVRAGGAYVPLDPSHPDARIAFVLDDADPVLVIAHRDLTTRVPAGRPVLHLDDASEMGDEGDRAIEARAHAGSLAYVMYTSGSTGRPKGVAIEHRGVIRLVKGMRYARLDADEVFLQLAPVSFDAATFEIWGALLNGARLALTPPGTPSLQAITQAVHRYGVTTLWLTAGLFHAMVDTHPRCLRDLRQLIAGGDTLSPEHVRRARQAMAGGRLINGYGPTENTTFTTCHAVTSDDESASTISIGRPIENTRVYIVDRHLQPLPVGMPGELCTAGDGLARGYLNRPDLTAERFVSACGEARLYRTGDRARWRDDGTLEFLGRLDRQVKIRGFRVE
ncbi:MAG: amino acid adenylation domain-containing protein, partial [Proteobacteria bacterium]|nr:amino acid adenylation domain-containing protein [Pseudomonadota bacterium]